MSSSGSAADQSKGRRSDTSPAARVAVGGLAAFLLFGIALLLIKQMSVDKVGDGVRCVLVEGVKQYEVIRPNDIACSSSIPPHDGAIQRRSDVALHYAATDLGRDEVVLQKQVGPKQPGRLQGGRVVALGGDAAAVASNVVTAGETVTLILAGRSTQVPPLDDVLVVGVRRSSTAGEGLFVVALPNSASPRQLEALARGDVVLAP